MKRLLYMVPLVALWAGCTKGAGMPMDVGKTWTYQIMEEGEPTGDTLTIAIAGEERAGDVECYVMEYKINGEFVMKRWLDATGSGLEEHKTKIMTADAVHWKTPGYYIKDSMETGAQWGDRVDLGPPFGGKMKYMGTVESEQDVTVPAGKFKAWRIRYRANSGGAIKINELIWFVPGTGIVKMEIDSVVCGAVNVVKFTAVLTGVK